MILFCRHCGCAIWFAAFKTTHPTRVWWLEKISSFIQIATMAGVFFRFVQKLFLWMEYWNRGLFGNSGLPWEFGRGSERTGLVKLWKMILLH
jgi:hypothetical protein